MFCLGDNQSETMPAVANPSIAPSIGDASLGMTNSLSASGSHMDRVGILRDADSDRDSASNRAIAGASLNGSLCGSTYTNKSVCVCGCVLFDMCVCVCVCVCVCCVSVYVYVKEVEW